MSPPWFAEEASVANLVRLGFRVGRGGAHQSKTLMLRELSALLAASRTAPEVDVQCLVLERNVLDKSTGSARRSALERLNGLYALSTAPPISRALSSLWATNSHGQPALALTCALARDPLLRDSASVVLRASRGSIVGSPDFARIFSEKYPHRFSEKMLNSLSRNCASTWTQTGHLSGRVGKTRQQAHATPSSAAFAALLASLAGFGGPSLLASPWLAILDRTAPQVVALLREAEGLGLTRVRSAGEVVEIVTRQPFAQQLGIPELA